MGVTGSPALRWTGRQTVGRNITWNWTCVIALQFTNPSSCQSGRPTWKINKVIVTQRNVRSGHLLQKRKDTKTNWPTDRRSQYNLNLNLNMGCPDLLRPSGVQRTLQHNSVLRRVPGPPPSIWYPKRITVGDPAAITELSTTVPSLTAIPSVTFTITPINCLVVASSLRSIWLKPITRSLSIPTISGRRLLLLPLVSSSSPSCPSVCETPHKPSNASWTRC
jgi:hypothetical protein